MIVNISDRAQADLAAIVGWIGQDDLQAATRFGDLLVAKAYQIGDMPYAFPLVAAGRDLRKRSVRNHVIIYRATTNMMILRILDARRDYIPLLDDL